MSYSRFAIYYLPPDGALAAFGAKWLGWDISEGVPVTQPALPGLHDITATPRKYGFHGTLKPPFRIADIAQADALPDAVADIAARMPAVVCGGLVLSGLGQCLALTPTGDTSALKAVATACVTELDHFRAPALPAEVDRRRAAGLSAKQEAMLADWGYPYVLDEFRFHLTLTGRLPVDAAAHWHKVIANALPSLPAQFEVRDLALCGERESDGRFELIHRFRLTG